MWVVVQEPRDHQSAIRAAFDGMEDFFPRFAAADNQYFPLQADRQSQGRKGVAPDYQEPNKANPLPFDKIAANHMPDGEGENNHRHQDSDERG